MVLINTESASSSPPKLGTQPLLSIRNVAKSFGRNPVLRDISLQVAEGEFLTVLGESGSGKEAVARIIHNKSQRAGKPFVAMDCGAIPKDISAGELFGYEKGAFTGAVNAKPGHFEIHFQRKRIFA